MKSLTIYSILIIIIIAGCRNEETTEIDLYRKPNEVEIFAEGKISTPLHERDMAISPDGNIIIYTLCDYKQLNRCLVMVKRTETGWGYREILSISGKYSDVEPFFSIDGNALYFASNRPIYSDSTRTDYNIWVSKRTPSGWREPEPLDSIINTRNDEFYPSLSKNGNIYFTGTRENGIGREDIFVSRLVAGKYQLPEPLDSIINTPLFEFNAYISPDEHLLIFSSFGRKDGFGGGDLYMSQKDENGRWTTAVNLGENINSDKLDFCPYIDFPRGNFYFTSEKAEIPSQQITTVEELHRRAGATLNGTGNIYRVKLEQLYIISSW